MRVLIVSQYYPPEGSAAFYPASLATNLVSRGNSVQVVTGYPNYPIGELYPGYEMKWRTRELEKGVEILRVPLYIDHSQSAIKRIANYISFAVSSALTWRLAKRSDVIYVYATQMTPALGPWLWRMFGGPPYVLHVQDLWPDSITGSSLIGRGRGSKVIERVLEPWMRSVYRHASAVIGIAPRMVETLVARGVPENRAHLIYNWGSDVVQCEAIEGKPFLRENTEFLYAGNVGDMQDIETVVRAGAQLVDSGVCIRIVGGGVALDRVKNLAKEMGALNIFFEDPVPMEEVGLFYKKADYSLVTLKDLPNFRGTIPSKFQAALAHGTPVITTVQGDLRDLVESLEVGFTAESENVDSLMEAMILAASVTPLEMAEMIKRANKAHQTTFSMGAGIGAVERILDAASES